MNVEMVRMISEVKLLIEAILAKYVQESNFFQRQDSIYRMLRPIVDDEAAERLELIRLNHYLQRTALEETLEAAQTMVESINALVDTLPEDLQAANRIDMVAIMEEQATKYRETQ